MANFNRLLENSKKFENDLCHSTEELIAVRVLEKFEDALAKKLRDINLFSSKSQLLKATVSLLRSQPQEPNNDKNSVLERYGDAVAARTIEAMFLKSAAQGQAVKALLTAPNSTLTPELLKRKKDICAALRKYQTQEALVQALDKKLREQDEMMIQVQQEWDAELGMLKDMTKEENQQQTVDTDDPLYQRLASTVSKLQKMSWLSGRLGLRTKGYDWLADPEDRLRGIKMARTHYTVDMFLKE